MRNLKRALSLTLASVMLLGMMIVGTSAASFNDADDITNVTAATILQEIGVMVGDGENFMPDQIVTRGQMAIIVCKLLYGDKLNVSQFEGSTQYTDVKVGDYFNGYVNLATSLGIISGYGNGQFGPGDPVTTAQAALMLTKALGYFKGNELTGDWAVDSLAAITKATTLRMFSDMTAPASNDGLSRDNVAGMVFNTITKAVTVEYNANFDIYFNTGAEWANGVIFNYRDTMGFKNYSLVYRNDRHNGVGIPYTRWGVGTYSTTQVDENGDLIPGFVTIADLNKIIDVNKTPLVTYNTKLVNDSNYNSEYEYTGGATSVVSDGGRVKVQNDVDGYIINADLYVNGIKQAGKITTVNDIAKYGIGNGVVINLYTNSNGEITDMAVIDEQLAKVTAINTSKQEITFALSTDHQNNSNTSAKVDSTSPIYQQLIDANVAVDDYLLLVLAGDSSQSVKRAVVPETVAGRVENYSDKGALTVDGTTYEASIIKSDVATSQNSRELTKPTVYTDTTTEAVLYLDSCGNVVAVENNIDENIVYVARTHDETGFGTTITVYGFFADGGKGVYTLASYNGSTETAKLRNVGEGLYFYTVDGSRINLRDTNTTAGGSAYLLAADWTISNAGAGTMAVSHSNYSYTTFIGGSTAPIYVDRNTTFFTHDTTKDSTPEELASDATLSGFMNVSNGLTSLKEKVGNTPVNLTGVRVIAKKTGNNWLALAVYGEFNAPVAAASSDLIFIANNNWVTSNNSEYTGNAVFTGDNSTQKITVKGQPAKGLYTYTQKDGIYELTIAKTENCAYGNYVSAETDNAQRTKDGAKLDSVSEEILKISGAAGAADVLRTQGTNGNDTLIFDATSGELVRSTRTLLTSEDCYGYVIVDNTNDKKVVAVYVTKAENKGQGGNEGGDQDPTVPPVEGEGMGAYSTVEEVNNALKTGNVVINGTWKPGNAALDAVVNIPAGKTLKVSGGLDASGSGAAVNFASGTSTLIVEGELKLKQDISGIVYAGSLALEDSTNVNANVTVTGNATVAATKNLTIAAGTTMIVGGNLTATATGGTLTVNGHLEAADITGFTIVNDNSSNSIVAGSISTGTMNVGSATQTGKVTVSGSITVTTALNVVDGAVETKDVSAASKTVTVTKGSLTAVGTVTAATVEVKAGATAAVENLTVTTTLALKGTAAVTVNGTLNVKAVTGETGSKITFGTEANVTGDAADKFQNQANGAASEDVSDKTFTWDKVEGEGSADSFVSGQDKTSAIKNLDVVVVDSVKALVEYSRAWNLDNGKTEDQLVKMWVGESFTAETADAVLAATPYVLLRWGRNENITTVGKVEDIVIKCGDHTFNHKENANWIGTFAESGYFENNYGASMFLFNTSAADAGTEQSAPGVTGVDKAPGTYEIVVTWEYNNETKTATTSYTVPEVTPAP